MELAMAIVSLETAHAAVSARPTLVTDGVDVTAMKIGGYTHVNLTGYVQKNGADVTVTSPAGGAKGVEIWVYKPDKTGTSYWWLEGYVNAGADLVVAGAGGWRFPLVLSGDGTRIAIAGVSSDGAHIPVFFFEPVEHIMQVVS